MNTDIVIVGSGVAGLYCALNLPEYKKITIVTKDEAPKSDSFLAQGGIDVDKFSKTSMERLYAVGETACNGVHGKNRLASNSLLESLVFSKRAAGHMVNNYLSAENKREIKIDPSQYDGYEEKYKNAVLEAIEKEKKK